MAETLREIKNRIRGVGNVNKITHAMEMVSIAKLKPIKSQLANAKPYFLKIEKLFKDLLVAEGASLKHPFFEKRQGTGKRAVCVITSDTGLCGNYNYAVIRMAEDFINKLGREKTLLVSVGRKGFNYFKRRGVNSAFVFTELKGHYSQEICAKILKTLTDIFLSKEADEVYLAYAHFESASRHRPVIEKLLSIDLEPGEKVKYIFEPDFASILEELIPEYIFHKMRLILLNSFTAEHSSRVIAMGEATQNADNLLEELVLLRNKVRQANITREILEIISSVEVMR